MSNFNVALLQQLVRQSNDRASYFTLQQLKNRKMQLSKQQEKQVTDAMEFM